VNKIVFLVSDSIKQLIMKKNASTFYLLLSAVTLFLIAGCQKSITNDPANSLLSGVNRNGTVTPLGTTPDIYVAGSDNGNAVYWKNGVEVSLPGGNMATGIVAIGTNVYVCGYGVNPSTGSPSPQYWLNGVLTNLPGATSFTLTSGIAVSGSDVYICGYDLFSDQAWYWKNGVINTLPSGEPTGIAITSTGDIYMSNDLTVSSKPSYYKNGVLMTLPGDANAHVLAVTTSGTHWYMVGYDDYGTSEKALLWEDGIAGFLVTSPTYSEARAVAVDPTTGLPVVSGISGSDPNNLQISWWNGLGDLNILASGEYVSTSTGITVDASGNTYVCGSQFNTVSTPPARAWEWAISTSGSVVGTQLSSGTTDGTAHAICIGQ